MAPGETNGHSDDAAPYPFINLSYDSNDSEQSLFRLVYQIRPDWQNISEELEVVKFTEGITNTLLKVARKAPGASQDEIDRESVLMRAYGNNTDILIDRDREARSHSVLAARRMAPPLLARFQNGLLYGFIPGKVCTAQDLTQEQIWRGIARKLGEWHARVPISAVTTQNDHSKCDENSKGYVNGGLVQNGTSGSSKLQNGVSKREPTPNIWSVMQKWINALSVDTEKERARKEMLQQELDRSFQELDNRDGIGEHGFVFGHCDLLCANVIQLQGPNAPSDSSYKPVTFIDYEYATPAPAAFDISNHFAEWVGYDCDYSRIPTKSVRRAFLQDYVAAYSQFSKSQIGESAVEALYEEVDRFRGMPGLYWGIWSLIQARISQIDFDYASYAEERLGEYFAWRREEDGSRVREGKTMPLRESRWAEN